MVNIIILEDEEKAADALRSCLEKYAAEVDQTFKIKAYKSAITLLEEYDGNADLLFLDIQLPYMTGMEAAHKIRDIDKNVIIVFVTNLAQYAIEGYEVDAYDFVLKPVSYPSLALKLKRLISIINQRKLLNDDQRSIIFNTKNSIQKAAIEDIIYIEVSNHNLIVHLTDSDIHLRGTISSMYEKLKDYHFVLCNSCYLVNLAYVKGIDGDEVMIQDKKLKISQPKRKSFMQSLATYFGGGGNSQ